MNIVFPSFSNIRILMMPYIQGDHKSVPESLTNYSEILDNIFIKKGDIGYLTIDETFVNKGKAQRAARAKYERAIHTEVGRNPDKIYGWGDGGGWGSSYNVTLDRDVKILVASNIDNSCAVWDAEQEDTSEDGDIGHLADKYPYETARKLKAGEVAEIGILTPHESLPMLKDSYRQFIRIISSGVHGSELYFTQNPILKELK